MTTETDHREANVACVRRVLDKISTGRFDELAAEVTEDLVFELPYGPKGMNRFTGRDRWDRMQQATFQAFSRFVLTETAMYPSVDPDLVVAEYESDAVVTSSGKEYRNTYIGVFGFRDGQIATWKEFTDPRVIDEAFSTGDQARVGLRWVASEAKALVGKFRRR